MSDTSGFRVHPRRVFPEEIPTAKRLRVNEPVYVDGGALVLPAVVLALVLGSEIVGNGEVDGGTIVLVIGLTAFLFGLLFFAARCVMVWKAERRYAETARRRVVERNQASLAAAQNEAESLTSVLRRNYTSSQALVSQLPAQLERASAWLRHAEAEFNENAFSPFWDAVENSAAELGTFVATTKELAAKAAHYHASLAGREHTFPPFPVQPDRIPDASAVLHRFYAVVRRGQTNFQFANIWEHRRTRTVLIAGFRNLGQAINSIGGTIESSLADLQAAVSSGATLVGDEEKRTRETLDARLTEQNRILTAMRRPDA